MRLEVHGLTRRWRALPCDSACLANYSAHYARPFPQHTPTLCHIHGSGSLVRLRPPTSRSEPLIPLFLASDILGTYASAQCKLFSLACQRLGANHKSQMVSGYFIRVTVVKHQCTESFWNPHKYIYGFITCSSTRYYLVWSPQDVYFALFKYPRCMWLLYHLRFLARLHRRRLQRLINCWWRQNMASFVPEWLWYCLVFNLNKMLICKPGQLQ